MNRPKIKNGLFWTIAILIILTNLLLTSLFLFEIFSLLLTDIGKEYHWGAEPFPWYYKTQTTYLTYSGIWTTSFITILIFQIRYLLKNNKTRELYFGLIFVLLISTMFIVNVLID